MAAVDPLPRAKSFNGSTLHGNSAEPDVGDKVVAALEVISLKEVAENESWMVIYDKVYDLTEFFSEVTARIRFMLSNLLTLTVVNLLFLAPWRRGGPDGKRRSRRQQPVPECRPLGGRPQNAGRIPGRHLAAGRANVEHSIPFFLDMISSRSSTRLEKFRTR